MQKLISLPNLGNMGFSFTAIGSDSSGKPEGYDIKLSDAAKASVTDIAKSIRKRYEDLTLVKYEPAVLIPPQHCMHVDKTVAATFEEIETVVRRQDLTPFKAKSDEAKGVKMLAARFSQGEKSVTFYRVSDTIMQFKSSKFLGLIQEGDVYGRLDPTDVLLMRAQFEVVAIDGYAFFANKATFERAFGFLEELKKESLATFTSVTGSLAIEGMDQLKEACTSQPQMMAKMASIRRNLDNDPDYASAMTMERLITYIETHPHVDIDIVGTGTDRKLVFDPRPARRFQIVKLLDDDFLHSVLTSREYEAGSKTKAI